MFMSSFNFIFKTTEKHKAPINFFPGDRLPHRPRDFQSGTKALYCTVDLQDHHEQSFYCHISTFGDFFKIRIWHYLLESGSYPLFATFNDKKFY